VLFSGLDNPMGISTLIRFMLSEVYATKRPINRISIAVQPFCRAHELDHQTDTQTDHATPSVAIGRI